MELEDDGYDAVDCQMNVLECPLLNKRQELKPSARAPFSLPLRTNLADLNCVMVELQPTRAASVMLPSSAPRPLLMIVLLCDLPLEP